MTKEISAKRINYLQELSQTLNIGEVIVIEEFKKRNISKTSKFLIKTSTDKFLAKFYESEKLPQFLDFVEYLNSRDFPTNVLIANRYFISPEKIPCLIYSYVKGRTKSYLNEDEIRSVSELVARLHTESNLFYERKTTSDSGITHGDINLTNIVYNRNEKPFLLDFDKLKVRDYISDVASFLFFNSLSDLFPNDLEQGCVKLRGNLFIEAYENARQINLNKEQISSSLAYQSRQFLKFTKKQFREGKIDDETVRNREIVVNSIDRLFS